MGQRILYEKIDKTKIANLPLVIFEGKIWVIDSLLETEKQLIFEKTVGCWNRYGNKAKFSTRCNI